MPRIVILGAGIGGVPMAFELRQLLPRATEVLVVNEGNWFNFVPSNPWVTIPREGIRAAPVRRLPCLAR